MDRKKPSTIITVPAHSMFMKGLIEAVMTSDSLVKSSVPGSLEFTTAIIAVAPSF